MLRKHTIRRHSNGCFYLQILQGHGNSKQLYKYDLTYDVENSRELLKIRMENIRVEELPLKERERLLESITDDVALDEPYVVITSRGHIPSKKYVPLPNEVASNSFNVSIPNTVYVGY